MFEQDDECGNVTSAHGRILCANGRHAMVKEHDRRLLNKRQLADYLGLQVYTIDAWVSQRRIPHIKLGKCVRFDLSEIETWLKGKKVERMSASF